jgi:hypothetical protein
VIFVFLVLPYVVQGIMGVIVGFLGDYLIYSLNVPLIVIRKGAQCIGVLGTAVSMIMASHTSTIMRAVIWITLGQGINTLTLIGVSMSQHDIAPKYAGGVCIL